MTIYNLPDEFAVSDLPEEHFAHADGASSLADAQAQLVMALIELSDQTMDDMAKSEATRAIVNALTAIDEERGVETEVILSDLIEEVDGEEYVIEQGEITLKHTSAED